MTVNAPAVADAGRPGCCRPCRRFGDESVFASPVDVIGERVRGVVELGTDLGSSCRLAIQCSCRGPCPHRRRCSARLGEGQVILGSRRRRMGCSRRCHTSFGSRSPPPWAASACCAPLSCISTGTNASVVAGVVRVDEGRRNGVRGSGSGEAADCMYSSPGEAPELVQGDDERTSALWRNTDSTRRPLPRTSGLPPRTSGVGVPVVEVVPPAAAPGPT